MVVREKINKLLKAQFIREVKYSTWLANVVMVKKANGKWGMFTDDTILKKVCPKDVYPLPNIDKLMDGVSGFQLLSFLDTYSRYNQIRKHPLDEEKTAFITEDTNFCYRVMPSGLKNARATYKRIMDRVFKQQIGQNVKFYVDDMVVKSHSVAQHLIDLEEVFGEIHKYNMCLNPEKYTFGVGSGKFLGFMITHKGIKANLDKCTMILEMHNPTNVGEVEKLKSRLTSLSRFLPKLAEKARPFYKLLKNTELSQNKCVPGRISKGSSNPRSTLGESHQTQDECVPGRISEASSIPRSALSESRQI